MKFIILTCLLLASFANAQEQEPPTEGPAITTTPEPVPPTVEPIEVITKCLVGEIVNDEGFENITEIACDFKNGGACQTKIETRTVNDVLTFRAVVRVCTQMMACENNAKGNDPKCYPGENNIRQCFYCCQDDLCNSGIDIQEQE